MYIFEPPTDLQITHVFIETGTNAGHSLALALAAGYEECLSVECVEHIHLAAKERFAGEPRARLFHGSSPELLPQIIDPAKSTTFWLDAHYSGSDPSWQDPKFGECPLLAELQAIMAVRWGQLPYILIDDATLFHPDWSENSGRFDPNSFTRSHWPTVDQIAALLPDYDIREENNILVCRPLTHCGRLGATGHGG